MKSICFTILLILPGLLKSQVKKISDTSTIFGMINEKVYGGRDVNDFCNTGFSKEFSPGTILLICGTKSCIKTYSKDTISFYEILYRKDTYYVEKNKITTLDDPFDQILKLSDSSALHFKIHAKEVSELIYDGELKKALKFLDDCKPKGLCVIDWKIIDESEYTEGTSVEIKVYNPTNKIIKYIWFTCTGYNPVGDKITDKKRGSNITIQAVGPINSEDTGTYNFTYVWFTDLVHTAKIISIKVQYMDGSIKFISNPKEITISDSDYEIIFGN